MRLANYDRTVAVEETRIGLKEVESDNEFDIVMAPRSWQP